MEETLKITEKSEKIVPPRVTFLAGGGQLVFNSDLMTVRRAATLAENNNNDSNTINDTNQIISEGQPAGVCAVNVCVCLCVW